MIALHMIVSGREKPEMLQQCLNSMKNQVHGVFVTVTTPDEKGKKPKKLITAIERYGASVDYEPTKFTATITKKMVKWLKKFGIPEPESEAGDEVFLFDKARNHVMARVPKEFDWLFWMDSDDVFRGDLGKVVEWAIKNNLDSAFLNYIYQAEIVDGKIQNVVIEHLRERVTKNNGFHKWVGNIHETLIEQKPTRKGDNDWSDVLHMSNDNRTKRALLRNVTALEYNVYKTEGKDPRPVYYLGKVYFDSYILSKEKQYLHTAKDLFLKYVSGENPSGWPEERAQCWEYLVECYRALGEHNNSIKCAHNALIEDSRFPTTYINMAYCYLLKKEYERAIHWIKLAAMIDQPKTTLVISPRDMSARSLEIIYHASIHMGKMDEAWAAATKLVELFPGAKEMVDRLNFINTLKTQRDLTKSVLDVAKFLEASGEQSKLTPLLLAVPKLIEDNPYMAEMQKRVIPPKKWGEDELAIVCGPCFTPWSPETLKNPGESFVGGSEEAVIYQAQELKKLGWKVSVYADPGAHEGDHDGVKYLPYFKFNPKDEFNILIGWRRPDFVDANLNAKKIYIWMHDIANQLEFTPERLEKIHKIMVLSPWHRENIPDIPDDKILITSNGISIQ